LLVRDSSAAGLWHNQSLQWTGPAEFLHEQFLSPSPSSVRGAQPGTGGPREAEEGRFLTLLLAPVNINLGVGRRKLFGKPQDYSAFEPVLAHALDAVPVRLLPCCLMPNHAPCLRP